MDGLYQNFVVFLQIFSCNNPNGICNSNRKTCHILISLSVVLFCLILIALIYFALIGLGFLTSYILNHQSYDILTGCPLNEPNCPITKFYIFCHARDNDHIFGLCLVTGLLSTFILFLCSIIGIPILYYIINGVITIISEMYESFKNTKESIVINHDVKLDDDVNVKLDDVNVKLDDDVKLDK